MPDPIAVNKDKKIIKEKLKPNRYEFLKKYPALAKIAAPVIYDDVHPSTLKPHSLQGLTTTPLGPESHNLPSDNRYRFLRSDATKENIVQGAKRGLGVASGTGRALYRGLGSVVGKVLSVPAWAYGHMAPRSWGKTWGYDPNLGSQMWEATKETYDRSMKKDVADIGSNALSLFLNKDVDARETVDAAMHAKRQRERSGDHSYTWRDAMTTVADEINDPDIQKKEYQRIANQRGLPDAKSYEARQATLDTVGDMYGPVRTLPHVPGAMQLLSSKPALAAEALYGGTELAQRTLLNNKDEFAGEYELPMSISGWSHNKGIDTDAIKHTWITADNGVNAPLVEWTYHVARGVDPATKQPNMPQQWFDENGMTRDQFIANVFQAGHEFGPEQATSSVVNELRRSNGLSHVHAEHIQNKIIPRIREQFAPKKEVAPAEAEPGMLDKIQGSLSSYGQGASQALGYGEQYKKLSPMMQAAIPALLAAGGLGAGGYGLYKLFGGGSGEEEEEVPAGAKTAAAYPALTKQAFIGNLLSKFKGKGPVPGDPEFEDKLREFVESRDMLSDPAMQDMLDAGPTLDNSSPGQTASEMLGFDPNTVSFKLDDDPSYDFATIDLPDLEEEAKTASAYPALTKAAFGSTEISIPSYMTEEEAKSWKKQNLPNPWHNAAISGLVGGVGTGLYSGIRRGSIPHGLLGGAFGLGLGGLIGGIGGLSDRWQVSRMADASVGRQREYMQDLTDALKGEEEEAKTASAANIPPHLIEKYPWLASSSSVEEALSDEEPAREEEAEATTGSADIPPHLIEKYPWLAGSGSKKDDDDDELSWKEILALVGGVGAVGLGGYGLYKWLKNRKWDNLKDLPTNDNDLNAAMERGEWFKSTPWDIKERAGGEDYMRKARAQALAARAANPNPTHKDQQHLDMDVLRRRVSIGPDGYPGTGGSVSMMVGPGAWLYPPADHIGYEWSPYRKMWELGSRANIPKKFYEAARSRYAAVHDKFKALMLGHEAGHITQSPALSHEYDAAMENAFGIPEFYYADTTEQEGAAMALKQWYHKMTGKLPQNDAEWNTAMDDYIKKGPEINHDGTYFNKLWNIQKDIDKNPKHPNVNKWQQQRDLMRQRIREKGPRVAQTIKQNPLLGSKQNPLLAGLDFLAGKTAASYPALTKSAIAIAGLPIDVKPEDFKGITRAEVDRIKNNLPHPLTQALQAGLASAAVSGTGQSILDGRVTPRAGKWALMSFGGGGLLGGIGQYLDNRRIRNALDDAVQKDIRDKQHAG